MTLYPVADEPTAVERLALVRSYVAQQRAAARQAIRDSDPHTDSAMWAHVLDEELTAVLNLIDGAG